MVSDSRMPWVANLIFLSDCAIHGRYVTTCSMVPGRNLHSFVLQGMEDLITQAFLHVDTIGPHVAEGHYDLLDQNGAIILPQIWEEAVFEQDFTVTMHMWPMPEPPQKSPPGPPPTQPRSPAGRETPPAVSPNSNRTGSKWRKHRYSNIARP
jgi:hypothetical protein